MRTHEEVQRAARELCDMVADTVKGIDRNGQGCPSGPIYAVMMGVIDLQTYELILDRLVKEGKIRKTTELLYWTGGK